MRTPLVVMTAALLTLLAGCVPGTDATPDSSSRPTATSTGSPSPSGSPAPAEAGGPITITCDALVSPEVMYSFNPNFTLKSDYVPDPGTRGAQALESNGLACAWENGTSGTLIEVSAAQPTEERYTAIMNELITTSNPVPTYEVEGYFLTEAGLGIADAGTGRFVISAASPYFVEPGDAAPIMKAAIAALG